MLTMRHLFYSYCSAKAAEHIREIQSEYNGMRIPGKPTDHHPLQWMQIDLSHETSTPLIKIYS